MPLGKLMLDALVPVAVIVPLLLTAPVTVENPTSTPVWPGVVIDPLLLTDPPTLASDTPMPTAWLLAAGNWSVGASVKVMVPALMTEPPMVTGLPVLVPVTLIAVNPLWMILLLTIEPLTLPPIYMPRPETSIEPLLVIEPVTSEPGKLAASMPMPCMIWPFAGALIVPLLMMLPVICVPAPKTLIPVCC